MRASFCLLFFFLVALTAHAGEPKIVETDTEIVVEINGTPEESQAAQKQVEERVQAAAKELEAQQKKDALSQRRAEREKNRGKNKDE